MLATILVTTLLICWYFLAKKVFDISSAITNPLRNQGVYKGADVVGCMSIELGISREEAEALLDAHFKPLFASEFSRICWSSPWRFFVRMPVGFVKSFVSTFLLGRRALKAFKTDNYDGLL